MYLLKVRKTSASLQHLLMHRAIALCLIIWSLAGFFMGGDDEVNQTQPWIVVLGGGIAGERLELACQLYAEGHGHAGVVLTGSNVESFVDNRVEFLKRCGIPESSLTQWPNTANTYQEVVAVKEHFLNHPNKRLIVVSDALHMPRLRFVRDKLGLKDWVLLKQSHLAWHADFSYLFSVVKFWFREPLAYAYYRLKY